MTRHRGWLAVLALGALAGGFGMARAQDKENPIVGAVKQAVKDPARPFTMLVMLNVKDGQAEKFEAAFAQARRETRKEKGNLAYDLSRDAKEPSRYLVYERWKSVPALEEHIRSPHITRLLAEIGPLLDGLPDLRVLIPAKE